MVPLIAISSFVIQLFQSNFNPNTTTRKQGQQSKDTNQSVTNSLTARHSKQHNKTKTQHKTKKNCNRVPAFGVINSKGVFARLTPNPFINLSLGYMVVVSVCLIAFL